MKKQLIYLICLMTGLAIFSPLTALAQHRQEIKVHDAKEFLEALGDHRTIVIAEGSVLNLSPMMRGDQFESLHLDNYDSIPTLEDEEGILRKTPVSPKQQKYYQYVQGGFQLILRGIEDLEIIGEGKDRIPVMVEPFYAYVLTFEECEKITLHNLEIGHVEEGFCLGGVLQFLDCKNLDLYECDLYGCGAIGIYANGVSNLSCKRSIIRNCTSGIMNIYGSDNVNFDHCYFFNNRQYDLIEVDEYSMTIKFQQCHFSGNQGCLFPIRTEVALTNCVIHHDGELGNTQLLKETDCKWMTSE